MNMVNEVQRNFSLANQSKLKMSSFHLGVANLRKMQNSYPDMFIKNTTSSKLNIFEQEVDDKDKFLDDFIFGGEDNWEEDNPFGSPVRWSQSGKNMQNVIFE